MPFSSLPQGNGGEPGWFAYLLIVLMAMWGGMINYLSRLRKSAKSFDFRELLIELFISAFSGILIGLIGFAFNIHWLLVLAMVGMAGHAGGRTVMLLDRFWGDRLKSFTKHDR